MENWQLAVVILASVLIGGLIPVLLLLYVTLYRMGKEVAEIGRKLGPTLDRVQLISERMEVVSRGLEGGEKNIADLLAVMGKLAHGIDRNMKVINLFSAGLAVAGPAVSAFVKTMRHADEKK